MVEFFLGFFSGSILGFFSGASYAALGLAGALLRLGKPEQFSSERRARRALSNRAKAAERPSGGRGARERRARGEGAKGAKRGSEGREASELRARSEGA